MVITIAELTYIINISASFTKVDCTLCLKKKVMSMQIIHKYKFANG